MAALSRSRSNKEEYETPGCFFLRANIRHVCFAQQAATATLSGRVVDPNGAVISGAPVTSTQKATGAKRETTRTDDGVFVIPNPAAGEYEVRAQAKNFADELISSVTLLVGRNTALSISLVVASQTIVIDDRFAYDLVDTNTSTVDGVVRLRLSRPFNIGERVKIEPIAEVFNLFNVTNVLGVSNVNYSGFANTLVRDSNDSTSPAFLRSSSFGRPVTTAGGIFGSGGPRAFQFAARVTF